MLGLTILDVAVGLVLVYLVLSLIGSALSELYAQRRGMRGKILRKGIRRLLHTGTLTDEFYNHRLIQTLGDGDRDPSYIPPRTFARVLLDIVLGQDAKAKPILPDQVRAKIVGFSVAEVSQPLLIFLDEAEDDLGKMAASLERWFNDVMDRVSGWYRRWMQKILLVVSRLSQEKQNAAVHGLYTFGQPRCGDQAFAETFDATFHDRTFRYVNNRDIVPRVPLRTMGYRHVGTVKYFDSRGKLYDDPGLWFRFLDTVAVTMDEVKEKGKEAVKDHSMTDYVELLRLACGLSVKQS